MELVNNASEGSNIAGAAYDPTTRTAEIEFRGGSMYRYADVPPEVGNKLLASLNEAEDSTGKFFAANMRGKFEFEKL